ncbi:MAG: class B sortase [Lachnospiraceae bacterium]|nr:class B sortase [Lachnospiraceae bacterium]
MVKRLNLEGESRLEEEKNEQRTKKKRFTPASLLILLLQVAFVVALVQVARILGAYMSADSSYKNIAESMEEVEMEILPRESADAENGGASDGTAEGEAEEETEEGEAVSYTYTVTHPDFEYLTSINGDVIGWIQIPGTAVNYPIVQGTDNEYYLTHLYTGDANSSGAIFLDAGTEQGLQDRNAIIFGHNMKNGGMFAALNSYSNWSYYNLHPYILVTGLDGTIMVYDIFSVYSLDASVEENVSAVYLHGFGADEVFEEYLEQVKGRSFYDTGIQVTKEDYIITLSTCQKADSSVRTIVQAVRR